MKDTKTTTPFPWFPMIAISAGLITHSYTLTSLFPYVGFMVQHMGVTNDQDDAGFYAGYLSSAFMIGRFSSSYFWGRFADRCGRLPVFYTGLWTMVFTSIGFGLSSNFYSAMIFRLLAGALNGIVGTSKTMISEICGKEHEVVGMSFVTTTWSIGFVIGPGLGGLLAEPAIHYPRFFAASGIFGRFPYLLPNLVGALFSLLSIPLTYAFLAESSGTDQPRDAPQKRVNFKAVPTSEVDADEEDVVDRAENGTLDTISLEKHTLESSGQGGSSDYQPIPVAEQKPKAHKKKASNESIDSATTIVTSASEMTHYNDGSPRRASLEEGFGSEELAEGIAKSMMDKELSEGTYGSDTSDDQVISKEMTGAAEEAAAFSCKRECVAPALMLAEKRVRGIMLVYGVYSFLNIGMQEVYPLWALSTVKNGGLNWTTKDIGQVLSLVGILMMIFQMFVYPAINRRMGVQRTQRWSSVLSIPLNFVVPFLSHFRGHDTTLVVVSTLLIFFINFLGNVMFVNIAVATNNSVDPKKRGELNGLAMMLGSLAKALGPFVFSVIFAWSIQRERPFPFGPYLAFLFLSVGTLVVAVTGWNIIKREGDDGPAPASSAKEDTQTELITSSSSS